MPVFRKLTPEEANQVKGIGPRKMIEIEYDSYLHDFEAGDSGEAILGTDENRLTVMNRLKAAARRREPSLHVVFRRTSDATLMRFKVSLAQDVIASILGAAPTAGKRGRKKKQ
jgi:hypothetical protein